MPVPDPGAAATTSPDPQRWALRAMQTYLVAILALSVFLALVVPYHATDALVYGQWSRLLGEHGGYFFADLGPIPYGRPAFFVPQGYLFWLFGAHEWIGRLLSLAFFVVFLWALFRLASDRELPPLTPWLAVVLAFAVPDIAVGALAGQTDVPSAAAVAVAGVLLWRRNDGPWTIAFLVVAAALAVLCKITALPALVGLGLACLIGDVGGLRRRFVRGALPLAAGAAIGVLYDFLVARHLDTPVSDFLRGKAFVDLEAGIQADASERVSMAVSTFTEGFSGPILLLRGEWFGPYVRILLLFGLAYAFIRLVRVPHRWAVAVALALALLDYLVGTTVLQGAGTTFLDNGIGAALGSLLLAGVLGAAVWCPEQWIPSRLLLARLLAWTIPPLIAWGLFGGGEDTRTLSPTWVPMLMLGAACVAMGIAGLSGLRRIGVWAATAAMLVVLVLALLNFRNYDGLGVTPEGDYNAVSALRELTPSTWTDPDAARTAADAQLGGLIAAAQDAHAPGTLVRSNDGRLFFPFPDEMVPQYALPEDCAELEGYSVIALITPYLPPEDLERMADLPCVTPAAGVAGSWGVWRVDAP